MKHALAVAFVAMAALSGNAISDDSASIAQAQIAVTSWLKLTDEKAYKQSWNEAASLFKRSVSKSNWVQAINQVRSPLGSPSSRSPKGSTFTRTLPGAPEGEYVVFQFETVFEKRTAVETVTPMKEEDGAWRVSGYFVR